MLRSKAYLLSRGLHNFGFFMVPRFAAAPVAPGTSEGVSSPAPPAPSPPPTGSVTPAAAPPMAEVSAAAAAPAAACKLFVRGFPPGPPAAAREALLRALQGVGCTPDGLELLSDR